jgi:hypothetical protein
MLPNATPEERIHSEYTAKKTDVEPAIRKIFLSTGLSLIAVSGQDAEKLLQGQLTCNINDISESQASIAAFCNAKGRVISTLIVAKTPQGFLLIVPTDLLETVLKKLRMYVLRADVQLHDQSGILQITGLQSLPADADDIPSTNNFAVAQSTFSTIRLPGQDRYLLISSPEQSQQFCALLASQHGYESGSLAEWRQQDICSALPWFGSSQSEQHIPQMLNIDRLGGISFNKGCYTGQEIVARTHYLGKVKRALFVAECTQSSGDINTGCGVLDSASGHNIGCVLTHSSHAGTTRLLLVLQIVDGLPKNLILDDDYRTSVAIISDQ